MLDHAQILGIENKGSSLIFIDRKILSRTTFFHNRVLPSTRMSACSLIGISSGQIIAQQASSGIGDTHRSVDKCLNLHIIRNPVSDLADLFERQLPCRYHTFGSHLIPELIRSIVGIVRLGTDVAFDLRTYFFCNLIYTRIRNDQRIRSDLFQLFKIFPNAFEILIMCQNVGCDIHFDTMFMGKPNAFCHVCF